MNYSELTDREINHAVDLKLYGESHKTMFLKDYCNNPSDAWPIIEEIWDGLMYEECRGCGVTVWEHVMEEYNCSKLRAAMIVYMGVGDE